jgi:hypothetical protein
MDSALFAINVHGLDCARQASAVPTSDLLSIDQNIYTFLIVEADEARNASTLMRGIGVIPD